MDAKQKASLEALRNKWQKQIQVNSESDYWWNMCGAAIKCDLELIDALLSGE